jgi:hypothetical protein
VDFYGDSYVVVFRRQNLITAVKGHYQFLDVALIADVGFGPETRHVAPV